MTDDRVPSSTYRDETFRRIVNRLLVAASALDVREGAEVEGDRAPDPVAAFLARGGTQGGLNCPTHVLPRCLPTPTEEADGGGAGVLSPDGEVPWAAV